LAQGGHEVSLWGRNPHLVDAIRGAHENVKFLPGIQVPDQVKVRAELEAVVAGAEFVVYAVPAQAVRETATHTRQAGGGGIAVCAAKGIEHGTLARMTEVLADTLGDRHGVVLTGPSHAEEVSRGIPTSVVSACSLPDRAEAVQTLFTTARFRVYTNTDVVGCEIGGALKNVIAIAAGVCDGIGFGDNSKGALLTRGLAEIARLGVSLGARRETFFGLAGMGDLIATAMSRHSRNRAVGERLGRGESLDLILSSMTMVAEGVHTARAAREMGRRQGVELPIIDQVCAILFEHRSPREALHALMTRDPKRED
jgi:glycerol-3-phosphate dehydrogenase (NAD(P)+)